jgi:hypothetical protein
MSSLVQSLSEYPAAGTITFPGNVTAGDLLIVTITGSEGTGFATIDDTLFNVWTDIQFPGNGANGSQAQVFWAIANASGACTVNINTPPGDPGAAIFEVDGIANVGTVNAVSAPGYGSGLTSNPTGENLVVTADAFIFAVMADEVEAHTFTAGAGYTLAESQPTHTDAEEYQTGAVPGTYNPDFNLSVASAQWVIGSVAFTESSTPPPVVLIVMRSITHGATTPFNCYAARLVQAGASVPVIVEDQNEIGPLVWTRVSAGIYRATLAGAFDTNGNTHILVSLGSAFLGLISGVVVSADAIEVRTQDLAGVATDLAGTAFLEVKVY